MALWIFWSPFLFPYDILYLHNTHIMSVLTEKIALKQNQATVVFLFQNSDMMQVSSNNSTNRFFCFSLLATVSAPISPFHFLTWLFGFETEQSSLWAFYPTRLKCPVSSVLMWQCFYRSICKSPLSRYIWREGVLRKLELSLGCATTL